ncbi:CopD family protein [Kingella negevensis]|uniref:Protoporphyrinogen IX oxidase n=1 Tax=Kingella negevensis TaxID=1522312 RepID=A0A238TBL8_9NEIS|nr:CopD family protein [Kingella negevensis]MDK4679253.1 CopD family protein [Kingella negevensis]MDK4683025.1 CopD family protein [Kingella negevensis]MDK4683782.1 CopD family protein [Kingella negevensis]MDK4691225.1 CopD family protein [Kingella negevensis]MDK4693627.1 CopD family protein [Kingella negevensis]
MYLWLKFAHIFFIISWFAGLFYLPRIYVNLAMTDQADEYNRLLLMATKLYKFMTPWGIGALICGILMPLTQIGFPTWVHGKIFAGLLLLGYQLWCRKILQDFTNHTNTKSHKWYRVFNELPVFALLFALYLVIFKPF